MVYLERVMDLSHHRDPRRLQERLRVRLRARLRAVFADSYTLLTHLRPQGTISTSSWIDSYRGSFP